MSYLSSTEKNVILTDLIDLAKADGMVNFSEMTYLLWVSQKLGVGHQELQSLMNRQRSDFDMISPDQRLEQFHRLLNMMYVDTQMETSEVEKCRELGYKMGLERSKVDHWLAKVEENPELIADLDEVKKHFSVSS